MRCPFVGIELGDKLEELGMCLFLTLLWNVSMYEVGPIEDELLCAHLRHQQTATRSQFRSSTSSSASPSNITVKQVVFYFPSPLPSPAHPSPSSPSSFSSFSSSSPSFFLPFQVHINSLNILFTCDHKYQELGVGS